MAERATIAEVPRLLAVAAQPHASEQAPVSAADLENELECLIDSTEAIMESADLSRELYGALYLLRQARRVFDAYAAAMRSAAAP